MGAVLERAQVSGACSGGCVRLAGRGWILPSVWPFLTWLAQGAVGPALFGLPFTSAATKWFRRMRRSDGLSRIVRAAAGGDVDLSNVEFAAIRHLLEEESTWIEV